jgi:hypothetical protein
MTRAARVVVFLASEAGRTASGSTLIRGRQLAVLLMRLPSRSHASFSYQSCVTPSHALIRKKRGESREAAKLEKNGRCEPGQVWPAPRETNRLTAAAWLGHRSPGG